MKKLLPALVALAVAPLPARAQDSPTERGAKLRDELAKKGPDARLAGEARLSAHLGIARTGFLVLKTEVAESSGKKIYRLEDRLDVDAPGLGALKVLLQAELAPDLSILSLGLETESPDSTGALGRRRLDLVLEGGKLVATEIRGEQKPVRRVLDVPPGCLPLSPPVGAGERLARLAALAGATGDLSLPALDLETLETTSVKVSVGAPGEVAVRGARVAATTTRRREAAAELEESIAPPAELLTLSRSDRAGRLSFVGREPRDAPDLPSVLDESPSAVVLRALRASGKGSKDELARLLDLDALWARATKGKGDPTLEKTWRKVLLERLTSDEWRRNGSISLIAGAASPEDLEERVEGDRAVVLPRSGEEPRPRFELARTGGVWRLVALPER